MVHEIYDPSQLNQGISFIEERVSVLREEVEKIQDVGGSLPADDESDPYYGGRLSELVSGEDIQFDSTLPELAESLSNQSTELNNPVQEGYEYIDNASDLSRYSSTAMEEFYQLSNKLSQIKMRTEDIKQDPTSLPRDFNAELFDELSEHLDNAVEAINQFEEETPSMSEWKEVGKKVEMDKVDEFDPDF